MKKVYLGVGHGGSDSGAVGYLVEKDVNLNIALACKEYLEANGVDVKISRTADMNKDLTLRIKECNEYDPNLAVDIHNNAGGGDGFEVYHTIGGGTGKVLAQNIEEEVKSIGQNSRGLKTKVNSQGRDYFGFIRQIKCPSIITETVFVDNSADASQADTLEEQKTFGQAIARGILKTLEIIPNNNTQVTQKEEISNKDTTVLEWQKMMNRVYNCGLAEDNCFGPDCRKKANKYYLHYKKPITNNEHVKFIQNRLCKHGFNVDIDSKFGPDCKAKTIQFQKSKGLKQDGCVGADTTKELLK